MPLSITDYFQVMQRRDFLRDHQYRVSALVYEGLILSLDELVYLTTSEIPNRTVNSVPVPFMGLNFNVPGTAQYAGTINLTFYCDQPQVIRSIAEAMSYATFDDRYSGGAYTVSSENRMTFYTYDNTSPDSVTTQYSLIGIYPTVVGAMATNTTGQGTALTLPVTFAYQFWEKETQPVPVQAPARVPTP